MDGNFVFKSSYSDSQGQIFASTYRSSVLVGYIHYPVVVSAIIHAVKAKAKTPVALRGQQLYVLNFIVQYVGDDPKIEFKLDRNVTYTYSNLRIAEQNAQVLSQAYPVIEVENV